MTMGFDPGPDDYVPVSRVLEDGRKECADENCEKVVKQDYWNSVKAGDKGWFFQKNGLAWCPDHTPEWVEAWRRKRKGTW